MNAASLTVSRAAPRIQVQADAATPSHPLFYAYALHGGSPCSLYIGSFSQALAEAMAYRSLTDGGTVHLEVVLS